MLKSLVVGGVVMVGLMIPTVAYGQFNGPISPTVETETTVDPKVSPLELQQFVQVIKQFQRIETSRRRRQRIFRRFLTENALEC